MTVHPFNATAGSADWPAGTGMVYLAISPWTSMWKNRHQLMSRFAREMPVLYVEPWRGLRRVRRTLINGLEPPKLDSQQPAGSGFGQLRVLASASLPPVSTSKLLGGLTQHLWLRAIRSAARDAGIDHPILWISHPRYASAIGRLGETKSIYHIVDEYGGYTNQEERSRHRLWKAEQAVLNQVDLAIAVSHTLVDAKSGHGADVHLVENAVDFDAFDAWRDNRAVPDDIAAIDSPRLGYCGLIGKRLNLDLIDRLAAAKPEYAIVLVGRVDERGCGEGLARLRAHENVHFLGEKPVNEVPAYVSSLDVGLLPYEINLETNNISPLKMYEYLAAGLPVISTAIPAAERQRDNVTICNTTDGFIDACRDALSNPNEDAVRQRLTFAERNSWDARVEEISLLIRSEARPEALDSAAVVTS